MQSQLQDLQEAHETAVHNLARSEKELTELRQRNTVLQTTGRGFNRDLELENASLREQLERLKEVSYGGPSSRSRDDDWGGVNGEELRRLREENCQLLEDNVKLTRHLQESENWAGTDTGKMTRGPEAGDRGKSRSGLCFVTSGSNLDPCVITTVDWLTGYPYVACYYEEDNNSDGITIQIKTSIGSC